MSLEDPVSVHESATNAEAHLIRDVLIEAGIEAQVTESNPHLETWAWFSHLADANSPQVMIERRDVERAGPILAEYEQRQVARLRTEEAQRNALGSVEAVCEDCGQTSPFVAALRGSIQNCPHCDAFMDVGEVVADDVDYGEEEPEAEEE